MGVWEYQLHPLTVADLRRVLDGLPDGAPVELDFYDGTDASRALRPMHIDLKGNAGVPSAVVINGPRTTPAVPSRGRRADAAPRTRSKSLRRGAPERRVGATRC